MGFLTTITLPWALTLHYPVPTTQNYYWFNHKINESPPDNQNRIVFMETAGLGSLRRMSSPDPEGNWFFAKRPIQSWSILEQKPANPNQLIIEDARGWPLLALRASFTGKTPKPGMDWHDSFWDDLTLHQGIRIHPHLKKPGDFNPFEASLALPLQPIYLNLIIDTLFWALIWLIIPYPIFFYSTFKYLRRRRRVHHNLCASCAYDLRGHSHKQCPECGTPIKSARRIGNSLPKWGYPVLLIIMAGLLLTPLGIIIRKNQIPWTIVEAVKLHNQNAIRAAVARGEDVNTTFGQFFRYTMLEIALDANDTDTVLTLLQLGAAKNFKNRSPLPDACKSGNPLLVHLMLAYGADPNGSMLLNATGQDRQPFTACIDQGASLEMVRMMLDCGAEVNPPPGYYLRTPLFTAMIRDDSPSEELIELLINAGADVNAINYDSMNALTMAASYHRSRTIRRLVQLGADVNATDRFNRNAIRAAISNCNLDDIKYLINHGAVLKPFANNKPFADNPLLNSYQFTLYGAVFNLHPEVMDFILSQPGFDINQVDSQGQTLLMRVVQDEWVDEKHIQRLLDHGADPAAGDQSKRNILNLCISPEIRKYIRDAINGKKAKPRESSP